MMWLFKAPGCLHRPSLALLENLLVAAIYR
jgi:hypothetical protein